jgi:hypothetical protein
MTLSRILVIALGVAGASAAQASVPIFAARCGNGMNVDADRTGAVYVDGMKAAVKRLNDKSYEARSKGTIISIVIDADGAPLVSFTGPGRANGICNVTASAAAAPASGGRGRASASERAGQGQFDATSSVPCSQSRGQPLNQQCKAGVARDGGGSATVIITRPDGRKRAIFFDKGTAVGADLSQADGNMNFKARKDADLYIIQAGDERYEVPEAVVFGG